MIDDDDKGKNTEKERKENLSLSKLKHNYRKQFETSSNLPVNDFPRPKSYKFLYSVTSQYIRHKISKEGPIASTPPPLTLSIYKRNV